MTNSINTHFRRESKIMAWLIVAPFVIGMLIAILYPYFLKESKIDNCLDSVGGFDYVTCKCDYTNNHEFKGQHKCK